MAVIGEQVQIFSAPVTSATPSGPAGGALDGTYPNPGIASSVAGSGLTETSDVLSVNVDGATLEIATNALREKDGGTTNAKLANMAQSTVKGRAAGAGTGVPVDLTPTQVLTIIDTNTTPSTQAFGDAAAVGTLDTLARGDHKHAFPSLGTGPTNAAAGNDSRLSDSRTPTGSAGGDLGGTYPNPTVTTSAGSNVGNALGYVGWTVVAKSADESVSASITLQNDDHLFFTAVSGAAYEIELFLVYASPLSGGTPDFKFSLGEDATGRGVFAIPSFTSADASTVANLLANQSSTVICGTAVAKRAVKILGSYVGNGGTFILKWAQGTSDANPTTLYTGSLLRYRRIV